MLFPTDHGELVYGLQFGSFLTELGSIYVHYEEKKQFFSGSISPLIKSLLVIHKIITKMNTCVDAGGKSYFLFVCFEGATIL